MSPRQTIFYIKFSDKSAFDFKQTQFIGAGDSFGAALHLQFIKNLAVMPFDRIQCEEKFLAYLMI